MAEAQQRKQDSVNLVTESAKFSFYGTYQDGVSRNQEFKDTARMASSEASMSKSGAPAALGYET